ncbi:MAG: FecR domain-containing protein [Bacteroidota bacterium]
MKQSFTELLDGYLTDELSVSELNRFFSLLEHGENRKILEEAIEAKLSATNGSLPEDAEQINKAVSRLAIAMEQMEQPKQAPVVHRVHFIRRFRFAAAAILLLMAGIAYVIVSKNIEKQAVADTQYKGDIPAPAITKATLTVAGGKRIILDSVMIGSLAVQGAASADKTTDGKLVYSNTTTLVEYHTLTNPKASKPQELELPDKSIVWLNAESSITFPTAFTGSERVVSITGEAYFEVVHDARKPFKVKAGNQIIEDIGTAFNVNAYSDEPDSKTTLFEGAASVSYGTQKKIIKAGEQSIIKDGAETIEVKATDGQTAAAWRKGVFNFEHADIATIMRQLTRWYNVEVRYEGKSNLEPFSGEIGRSLTLAQVLNGLEQSKVHFRIEEDKRIVIMP